MEAHMARKKSQTLTDAELRIMEVLWQKSEASVRDVTDALALEDNPPAYTTVLTMLRILHEKGQVEYHKVGRAFIYKPLVDRRQAQTGVIDYVLNRFFQGSPKLLVQNLLENESISKTELAEIKKRLDAGEEA
jgi:predicted transcriptional regulator